MGGGLGPIGTVLVVIRELRVALTPHPRPAGPKKITDLYAPKSQAVPGQIISSLFLHSEDLTHNKYARVTPS